MTIESSSLPEPGQIVQVRNLRYVVADVNRGSMTKGPLAEGLHHVQHMVSLTSIEDDALGEELRVVWELEPEARILDGVRWGAASSADIRAL